MLSYIQGFSSPQKLADFVELYINDSQKISLQLKIIFLAILFRLSNDIAFHQNAPSDKFKLSMFNIYHHWIKTRQNVDIMKSYVILWGQLHLA